MATLIATFSPAKLEPYINPGDARTLSVQMAASLTVPKGTRLAQLTASGKWTTAVTTKIATPVAGPTLAAAGTDGTLTDGVYQVGYTFITAAGETLISPLTSVTLAATNHVAVSAITLVTGATGVNVYITDVGGNDLHFAYTNNGAAHNILAPAGSGVEPPKVSTAYVKADGSQTPQLIAVYDFVTDSSGNVIIGPSGAVADLTRTLDPTATAYWKGSFLVSDLPSLTATDIALLGARTYGIGASQWIYIP